MGQIKRAANENTRFMLLTIIDEAFDNTLDMKIRFY